MKASSMRLMTSLLLLLVLLMPFAFADMEVENPEAFGFNYELDEGGRAYISGYFGALPESFEIPSRINDQDIFAVGRYAFAGASGVV